MIGYWIASLWDTWLSSCLTVASWHHLLKVKRESIFWRMVDSSLISQLQYCYGINRFANGRFTSLSFSILSMHWFFPTSGFFLSSCLSAWSYFMRRRKFQVLTSFGVAKNRKGFYPYLHQNTIRSDLSPIWPRYS